MALTVRENITAWLTTTIDAIAGVTARRPKTLNWFDELTGDKTVMVRQTVWRVVHEDGTDLKVRAEYDLACGVVEPDASDTSLDTRINALTASIMTALLADPACGGNADYEGLQILGGERFDTAQICGEVLKIAVTYSNLKTDFTEKGAR